MPGLGSKDRRKPAEQQPGRGRDECGCPEPKTRQRSLPEVCESHLGNAHVEDGQGCDSQHHPSRPLGWLAGKHGDEGRCDHERMRHPARRFSQAQERAVKPKIAGNPFAFALHAQGRKHERSGEQQECDPAQRRREPSGLVGFAFGLAHGLLARRDRVVIGGRL